jgi:ABC-type Mn2+/Zn2+ transport system permease subunit
MPFLAWAAGALACTLGLWVSYVSDLPTGPIIVCTFGAVLVLAAVVKWLFFRASAADAEA